MAEELQNAVAASRAANIDKSSYERLIHTLQRMAAPYEELPPVVMATTPEQKRMAAEYLKAQGVRMA